MIRNGDANWSRLELLCLLTLTKLSEPATALHMRADGTQDQVRTTDRSNNFGGTVSAPASSIAAGALGNAFATANMPTTAGVIPVNSSADCI
jgi:hypothetical protein